ncbi:cytochrome c [Ancylomarina euxinus]|uniref:Cytochrome c n=1 Tax=Ancylomarina euxinus TaxID=2283627 RepID=A0A425Y911_9BACT|nr:cytochrome c [Ancylomarina euxinus]MCZ4693301.1 cytochrome c [Ancylomarina euxinus]MUP13528.1 c-type cytochrome [Ancylomarina euxinus]RRG24822.1 cytochrome c [Ancylomarina euxinus]
MKTLKKIVMGLTLVFAGALFMAFALPQDKKMGGPWEIPAKYKDMKNSMKDDAGSLKIGKMLYTKHCKSCHGGKGEADGPKAGSMKTAIRSFKSAEFQAQSDGVLYYQSFVGRDEMPNYEKKVLDDEDRWSIINYLRTLK